MKHLVLILTLLFLTNCKDDGNTTLGNPLVSLNIAAYQPAAMSNKLSPFAVSDLQMCMERIRFKMEFENTIDPEIDEDNLDIEVGLVQINPTGTNLTNVSVPPGTYSRIEIDIRENCNGLTSPSVILNNDNDGGVPFETTESLTIKFNGTINITGDVNISLYIDNMITALDTVTISSEIKDKLEDIGNEGDF